jgi:NAD(P)H-flavin reductase
MALTLEGLYGRCSLSPEAVAAEYLLLASGSGIAPTVSLLRGIAGPPRRTSAVVLFHGVSASCDLLRVDALESAGARIHRVEFIPVVFGDGPLQAGPERRGPVHHAVDDWLSSACLQTAVARQAYLAGPPAMIEATYTVLIVTHGVSARDVAVDAWPERHQRTFTCRAVDGRLELEGREHVV